MAANYDVGVVLINKERLIFLLWMACTAGILLWLQPLIVDAWKALRDIPVDSFPMQQAHRKGKVFVSKEGAYRGYTLITQQFMPEIFLVNMQGEIKYRWHMPIKKILEGDNSRRQYRSYIAFENAHVYPNGDLLVVTMLAGVSPYGYRLLKIDKNSNLLWFHSGNIHHDMFISKDTGNIYTLRQAFTNEFPEDIPLKEDYTALADYVQVLSPEGVLLDEISIFEAFSGTKYAKLIRKPEGENAEWDATHANSVYRLDSSMAEKFPQFKQGSLLVSLRNMNALVVIDPDTRKVVWLENKPWHLQHDAKFVDNGNINILLFDNLGLLKRRSPAYRILEVNTQTGQVYTIYPRLRSQRSNNDHFGRVDRLPNGNTLITDSINHRVLEINKNGNVVWNYRLMLPIRKTVKINKKLHQHAIRSAIRYTKEQLPFLTQ